MNTLAKIGIMLLGAILVVSMVSRCQNRNAAPSSEVILKEYAKGLNLDAVTALAKKAKTAADFERLLNSQATGVNNIDLNNDGKVDYIKITEYGSGDRRGFSLTTEIAPGKVQEIATIEFKQGTDGATVQTTGNPSLYGPGSYHYSHFGLTDALLIGWLFSNRSSYISPYGHGHYPSAFGGGWSRQPSSAYRSSMAARTAGSTVTSSARSAIAKPLQSPNATKVAAKARTIANPTQSQRAFRKRTGGSSRSGGFGRTSRSGASRSGGLFGGK